MRYTSIGRQVEFILFYPDKKMGHKKRGRRTMPNPLILLVSPVGIEPTTY